MSEPAGPPPPPAADGRRAFTVESRSTAGVEVVWELVAHATRWREWSFLDRSDLERQGSPDPDGVGAVRRFTRLGVGSREEVVAWDPPRHLAYTMLSGFPVRHYRADVHLDPDDGGTRISWSVRFDERVPGTGGIMTAVLRRIVSGFARHLARYAERAPV